jgi:hypothetical protein
MGSEKKEEFFVEHAPYNSEEKNDDADFSIDVIAVLFRKILPTRVKHHLSRFPGAPMGHRG